MGNIGLKEGYTWAISCCGTYWAILYGALGEIHVGRMGTYGCGSGTSMRGIPYVGHTRRLENTYETHRAMVRIHVGQIGLWEGYMWAIY